MDCNALNPSETNYVEELTDINKTSLFYFYFILLQYKQSLKWALFWTDTYLRGRYNYFMGQTLILRCEDQLQREWRLEQK